MPYATAFALNRYAPPALSKRETVALGKARFQYQLEVMAEEAGGNRPLGRVSGAIIPVDGGFRVRIEGFRNACGADGRGAYRVFCDSGDCPLASREEAGRLYRLVLETAHAWLSRELEVNLAELPGRKSGGILPPAPPLTR